MKMDGRKDLSDYEEISTSVKDVSSCYQAYIANLLHIFFMHVQAVIAYNGELTKRYKYIEELRST